MQPKAVTVLGLVVYPQKGCRGKDDPLQVLSSLLGVDLPKSDCTRFSPFHSDKISKEKSLFGYIIGGWGWFSSRSQKVPTKGKSNYL